jgi:hypothetical protein
LSITKEIIGISIVLLTHIDLWFLETLTVNDWQIVATLLINIS